MTPTEEEESGSDAGEVTDDAKDDDEDEDEDEAGRDEGGGGCGGGAGGGGAAKLRRAPRRLSNGCRDGGFNILGFELQKAREIRVRSTRQNQLGLESIF